MEVFDRPADTYVAGFIGAPAMNFLPATLTRGGAAARLATGTEIGFTDGNRPGPDGRRLTIGIRAEHLSLGGDDLTIAVDLIEPLGSETLVHGRIAQNAGDAVVVKLAGHAPVEWQSDERIGIRIDTTRLHVFDAETGLRVEPVIQKYSPLPG